MIKAEDINVNIRDPNNRNTLNNLMGAPQIQKQENGLQDPDLVFDKSFCF